MVIFAILFLRQTILLIDMDTLSKSVVWKIPRLKRWATNPYFRSLMFIYIQHHACICQSTYDRCQLTNKLFMILVSDSLGSPRTRLYLSTKPEWASSLSQSRLGGQEARLPLFETSTYSLSLSPLTRNYKNCNYTWRNCSIISTFRRLSRGGFATSFHAGECGVLYVSHGRTFGAGKCITCHTAALWRICYWILSWWWIQGCQFLGFNDLIAL